MTKGYGLFLSKTSLVLPWSAQPQFFRSYGAESNVGIVIVVVVHIAVIVHIHHI